MEMKKAFCLLALVLLAFTAWAADSAPANPAQGVSYVSGQQISDAGAEANAKAKETGFFSVASTQTFATDIWKPLLTNTAFALFIMALAIALLYMASGFFQMPALSAMAKQEINDGLVTLLIAAVFIGFTFSASQLSQSLFGTNIYDQATNYSYKMLDKVSSVSSVLITANVLLNSIYTLYIPIGPIRRAVTIQLGPALRPLIDAVSFSLQFLITAYGEWLIFIFIFFFIQKWFIPLFFPVGIFLRAFPQTRGGGNALIGLSIALSTIYPIMFYIDGQIFADQFKDEGVFTLFADAARTVFTTLSAGGVASIFGVLSLIYVSPLLVGAFMMLNTLFINVLVTTIHLIVMFSILLPVLNIFVTISLSREISKLLGTEINLGAFTKLI